MSDPNNLIVELAALLEKYDAAIGFSCSDCSDTYGLYDERIIVSIKDDIIASADGWYLTSSDLK